MITQQFEKNFGMLPTVLARAPGRVNLLGEHVDYNDGFVLPAAIDRAVSLAAAPTDGDTVTIHALDLNRQTQFDLHTLSEKRDLQGNPLPDWARYPAGVAWALQQAGFSVRGMKAMFTSNVPMGAGLSSSAAVELAFAVTWQALGGWDASALQLAQISQRAENGYVGVNCGLMDQFASACGKADHALYFDTRSLHWEPVPLPEDTAIVIANSNLPRSLANSAYNERRAACEEAVRLLQPHLPGIRALRDVSPAAFEQFAAHLPPLTARRARHVVQEVARVEHAITALRAGDVAAFGALMNEGHASLRDLYEVSLPEIDFLVETAQNLSGCYGARLTGAGFGGCTVNLVQAAHAPAFIAALEDSYLKHTNRQAQVYLCRAEDGAKAHAI
ncbi:MAG: galactokinase [Anaerolineales bacterium]